MIQEPTTIFGLKYELRHGSAADDIDWIEGVTDVGHGPILQEFSQQNGDLLISCVEKLKTTSPLRAIMEIGVQRSGELSTTCRLMSVKPQETIYLGVDIKEDSVATVDKQHLNSFGLLSDSGDYPYVCKKLDSLGMRSLDLLIIDGFHSINQVFKDFRYAERLRSGGIVFLHDTNYHPGPKILLDCVNPEIFSIKRYFEGENDWGCAVLERL